LRTEPVHAIIPAVAPALVVPQVSRKRVDVEAFGRRQSLLSRR
jgi:hypothetical protein